VIRAIRINTHDGRNRFDLLRPVTCLRKRTFRNFAELLLAVPFFTGEFSCPTSLDAPPFTPIGNFGSVAIISTFGRYSERCLNDRSIQLHAARMGTACRVTGVWGILAATG